MATATLPTQMSSAAKEWLAKTVRSLRASLLKELQDGLQETYRLSIPLDRAELDLQRSSQRRRLEAWADEQARGGNRGHKETQAQARSRHLLAAVKLVGATWLNRLVVLGQMEALGLVRTPVLTGGWSSAGFREFREFAPALAASESEGYPFLLSLVFAELALDLPGLFGEVGLTTLVPMPTATLRRLVEALQADSLSASDRAGLWRDDTLLGWVYQFWNDPEREALDEKIREGGKIENHEIAAKTQLFTDRYMVEWMLQNSLGQLWFAICEKNGWTPEVVADGVLDRLEARRVEWRGRRERGEVELEALMPLDGDVEDRWKYWVPRELSHDLAATPARLAELRIFDPACGSGHFLVIAFDLLAALYEEEARHLGVSVSREEIGRSIVENNLHGLDIDPRAVQIAAAAVWLKLKTYAPKAELAGMNLVASNLGLASLPPDDPALVELVERVEAETGLPTSLTLRIVETLKGADYLGSLLRVSEAVDKALEEHERKFRLTALSETRPDTAKRTRRALCLAEARTGVVTQLESFVSRHSWAQDLGLRLRGEQLAAGVRFIRILRAGQYHLLVTNPPFQSRAKLTDTRELDRAYSAGKADLFSGFMQRAIELTTQSGISGTVTLSNWCFLSSFEDLRKDLLRKARLNLVADLGKAAFSSGSMLINTSINLFKRGASAEDSETLVVRNYPPDVITADPHQVSRNAAALMSDFAQFRFCPSRLDKIPGHPLIYWWDESFIDLYEKTPKLDESARVRVGLQTSDNTRFLRFPWEISPTTLIAARTESSDSYQKPAAEWVPYIKGAEGTTWLEGLDCIVRYDSAALQLKTYIEHRCGSATKRIQNESFYFRPGVAFSMIGSKFTARAHRFRSIFGNAGSSVFPEDVPATVCLLNSSLAKHVLESLNPTVNFLVGDVNRLPMFHIDSADQIMEILNTAFTQHEQARETSVEFRRPGPSPWTCAQQWAQTAVDRPAGTPLAEYAPVEEAERPQDHLSFAVGVALGRFGANGEGILDEAPATSLPHGILFLSAAGEDSLDHPAADGLKAHGTYLRTKFFTDDHLKRYEKRPIYFPLSSEKKSFVAWTSLHRWADNTLQLLLADYLIPELNRLTAQLADLAESRTHGDRKAQAAAQNRHEEVLALHSELQTFIKSVQEIAERGAPSPPGCPQREADAPFRMDLDDGVMINSAALWPLLLPHWKDPKTWWTELCNAKGKKDYDWSHLAARYFPSRVDLKCQSDPSLAVAHGVFWKYHPEKAYQWELRLQAPDELGPSFRLIETGSDDHRSAFKRNEPNRVREIHEAETRRRHRKGDTPDSKADELPFGDGTDD